MTETSTNRVAELWQNAEHTRELGDVHWMASQVVREYLNRLASGRPDVDWLTHLGSKHLRPVAPIRVLVLGCGEGWLERMIAPYWFIARIDAFDVAAGAVERAEATARAQGVEKIHYGVLDLNRDTLPDVRYDLIIAHSVLHHIEQLEFFFPQLERALAPDGLLLVNEYVGPSRFQFTDHQMEVINEVMDILPARYRVAAIGSGVMERKPRPTIEEMIAADPSEAVRSDELVAFVERHFDVVESIPYGGSVLHHLLYDIVPNFADDDRHDRAMLVMLTLLEEMLIDGGALPADFRLMVGRRKGTASLTSREAAPVSEDEPVRRTLAEFLGRKLFAGRGRRRLTDRRGVEHPAFLAHLNRLATGSPAAPWQQLAVDACRAAASPRTVLVLGDRDGELARLFVSEPNVERVVVGHREFGRTLRHEKVEQIRVELDGRALPENIADLVVTTGWFSAGDDPERAVRAVRRALKAGGRVIGEEYAGRPGLRMSATKRKLLDAMLAVLPQRPAGMRRRAADLLLPPLLGGAPHASELPAIVRKTFGESSVRPYGTLVLQHLFRRAALDPADPRDDLVVEIAAYVERRLMRDGVIEPDYVIIDGAVEG